nr:inorganic diphosphatase [uncultured Steroidobacter sp.]
MPTASPMELPARDPETGLVRVVIDTPKGSRNKYKFDPKLGVLKLSRILPAGMSFPHDFGSIPSTCAEDGDALDVMVLADAPLFPGCLVHVHLIGVLRAVQKEQRKMIRNDRLLATLETPVNRPAITRIEQVDERQLKDIEHFLRSYNQAQGREFRITGRGGVRQAQKMFRDAVRAFEQDKGT